MSFPAPRVALGMCGTLPLLLKSSEVRRRYRRVRLVRLLGASDVVTGHERRLGDGRVVGVVGVVGRVHVGAAVVGEVGWNNKKNNRVFVCTLAPRW